MSSVFLANVFSKYTAKGYLLSDTNIQTVDDFGNPTVSASKSVNLILMLKPLFSRPEYRDVFGADKILSFVKAYIVLPQALHPEQLARELTLADGRTLTIIDTTQSTLKPITQFFGNSFTGHLSLV